MTGPEHYREAERLLAGPVPGSMQSPSERFARAQAHATLALVAATTPKPAPPCDCMIRLA